MAGAAVLTARQGDHFAGPPRSDGSLLVSDEHEADIVADTFRPGAVGFYGRGVPLQRLAGCL